MHATSKQRHDEPAAPSGGALAVRITGAAATGAALTYMSIHLVQEAYAYDARACVDETSVCLTPWPLNAALSTVGKWPAVVVGAVWAAAVALTAWRPYRILGLSASAALLLASLIILWR
jgi:hypothetical protein